MHLNVYFSGWKPSPILRDNIVQGMTDTLDRFRGHIRLVNVYLEDVNGPKGGVDKLCRCVLHLKRMQPIVIEDRDQTLSVLLDRVASRVAFTLRKRIDRVAQDRTSGPGFAQMEPVEPWASPTPSSDSGLSNRP